MSKVINITDKLSDERPSLKVGEKEYPLNDSMETVFKFEELATTGNKGAMEAIKMALGEKAYKELKIEKLSVANFRVIMTAIMAAMQGMTYEETEARFQKVFREL